MATVTYLILLPLSVWLLGSVFGLLDHGDRTAALGRIAVRALPFLGVALLLGERGAAPILSALLTATALYSVWNWGLRAAIRRGWLAGPAED